MANYHGLATSAIVKVLSDAQTLPNAGSVDSTNMVNIVGATKGNLWINVYANTDITIATAQAFNIELEGYTSDTAASATPPFSKDNEGMATSKNGGGTAESDAHMYLLHKTSADGELAFSAGDLIAQCAVPEDLLRALSYDYVQLKYTTDADEQTEKVDAIAFYK